MIVDKIKKHEKRYTIFLVIIFIIFFLIIGKNLFTINDTIKENEVRKSITPNLSVMNSTKTFTLNKDNILKDSEALNSLDNEYILVNNKEEKISYQVLLQLDLDKIKECGCNSSEQLLPYIRYSLDLEEVKRLKDDNILVEGTLEKQQKKVLNLKLWLSDDLDINTDMHIHGKIIIEEKN